MSDRPDSSDTDLPETDLYAADLSAWADAQVGILQDGRWGDLDRKHLADILDRLGSRERRELQDRLGVVITGLLRWAEQVDLRCHGWAATLAIQRLHVDRLLKDNPSLSFDVPDLIAKAYPAAKERAVLESALFDESFSAACPFSEAEIRRQDFLPDPYGDDVVRGDDGWKRR